MIDAQDIVKHKYKCITIHHILVEFKAMIEREQLVKYLKCKC